MNCLPKIALPRVACALACLALGASLGCGPRSFEEADDLYAFVHSDDYAMVERAERGGYRFTARYLPPDAMMVNHYRLYERDRARVMADTSLGDAERAESLRSLGEEIDAIRSRYAKSASFQLTIEPTDGSDLVYRRLGVGDYEGWLQTLLFGLHDRLVLRAGAVDVTPSGYNMERTYGMTPSRTFLVSFPKADLPLERGGEVDFAIEEFGLGTGSVTFRFEKLSGEVRYEL